MNPHMPMTPVQQLVRQCCIRLRDDPSVQYSAIPFLLNGPRRAREGELRKVLWKHFAQEAAVSLLGLLACKKLGSRPRHSPPTLGGLARWGYIVFTWQ